MGFRSSCLALGAAAALTSGSAAVLAVPSDECEFTPFELTSRGAIVVSARLNGVHRALFLFDTGSSHSVISEDLALALSAPAVARATVASISGETSRVVVRLDRLEFGAIESDAVLPSVVSGAAIDETKRVRGVIGQDVLAPYRYTIDYAAHRIVWCNAPVPRSKHVVDFELMSDRGRFLIDVPQRDTTLRLVPDSAAEGLVLSRGAMPVVTSQWRTELSTLVGSTDVGQGRMRELTLGPFALIDLPVAIVSGRRSETRTGDGLLPLRFFKRVTFDGPARLLTIEGR